MRELDIDSVEQRLLGELRDEIAAVDHEIVRVDLRPRSETNVFDMMKSQIQAHTEFS
jgi:hypothetical protein